MAYTVPAADNLDFAAPGSYTVPAADALEFKAGDPGTSLSAAGSATASGQAALAQTSLSASGATNVTGSAKLAVQSQMQASGTAQALGSARLAHRTLAASGLATASATANLARQQLAANGKATATGSAKLRHTNQLRASGTAVATGRGAISQSLRGSGRAVVTGTAKLTAQAYVVPRADALDFATGSYSVPPADALDFPEQTERPSLVAVGTAVATGTAHLTVPNPLSASGTARATGRAALQFTAGFIASGQARATGTAKLARLSLKGSGKAIATGGATMVLTNVNLQAPGVMVAWGAPYQTHRSHDRQTAAPWGRRPVQDVQIGELYGALAGVERQLGLPWGSLRPAQNQAIAPYATPQRRPQPQVNSPWEDLDHTDDQRGAPWGTPEPRGRPVTDRWIVPPTKDVVGTYPFDSADPTRTEANPADVFEPYEPPDPTALDFAAPANYTPPASDAADLGQWNEPPNRRIGPRGALPVTRWGTPPAKDAKNRMPWGPRGSRDRPGITAPYDEEEPEPPPDPPPLPPELEVYLLMPSITASRVNDGAEVVVNQASVTLDRDSFTWQLSATLARREDLEAVKPSSSGPVLMDITINGRTWRFLVESYRRQRQFNSSSFQIEGRGQAAKLVEPYAAADARTENDQRSAQQLANDELEFTDWTLDWQLQDWTVPGGVYSYQERTPLQSIKRIAEAAGGVVYAERKDKVLHVEHRFPVSPWDWDSTVADVAIPDYLMTSLSLDWEPGPPHNAVWVAGKQSGVLVHVLRDNTSQDNEAPQVTDGLITERLAGRERGRKELAEAGNRARVPVVTTLLPSDPPGLVIPGQLVEVTEDGVTWRGQAQSVTVEASRQSAASVRQTVEIDRYYGL